LASCVDGINGEAASKATPGQICDQASFHFFAFFTPRVGRKQFKGGPTLTTYPANRSLAGQDGGSYGFGLENIVNRTVGDLSRYTFALEFLLQANRGSRLEAHPVMDKSSSKAQVIEPSFRFQSVEHGMRDRRGKLLAAQPVCEFATASGTNAEQRQCGIAAANAKVSVNQARAQSRINRVALSQRVLLKYTRGQLEQSAIGQSQLEAPPTSADHLAADHRRCFVAHV
jgi:hypothetical protein